MSKELIAKARELGESITAGPWMVKTWQQFDPGSDIARDIVGVQSETGHVIAECWSGNADAEAEFIAESRALMPALADLAESEGRRADTNAEHCAEMTAARNRMDEARALACAERDAALAELATLKGQLDSMRPVVEAVRGIQETCLISDSPERICGKVWDIRLPPRELP